LSSIIWTQCAGKSRASALTADAWRLVEDQSRISTRKLVDSDAEQIRLEELIETAKPPVPEGPEWAHLHYLLFTPFRYPPPPHGSRFRARTQPGVWYGSRTLDTAIAEVAYWRLRFLNDVAIDIQSELFLTAFMIRVRSKKAIDLAKPPFSAYENRISSKTGYAESQALGAAMREDGVEMCQYTSARDMKRGTNLAVFSPRAFASKSVSDASRETWHCFATKTAIEFRWQSFTQTRQFRFRREDFEVQGKLPRMGH
jgi:hypothetical protein